MITAKKLRIPIFILLAGLMIGAGKSEFYDSNFETSKLPVYLKGVLGDEPELTKISVRSVVPDSPAYQSGLRRGDEILSFGGQELNRSARTLYQLLYQLYENQSPSLELQIRRKGVKQAVTLQPDYDPQHVVLGIQYAFLQAGGQRAKSIQFVKREMSPEGVEQDAMYDFRDAQRVSTKCHWWGGKILVVEFDIFNDREKTPLSVNADQIAVTDAKGEALQALDPDSVVGTIYNKEAIWSANEAAFHWKKKEAQQMLEEMQLLREEISKFLLTKAEVPAKTRYYGVLYYLMSPMQPPVSVSAKFGRDTLSSKFEFGQEIASHTYSRPEEEAPAESPQENPESDGGAVPPPDSGNYEILL